MTTLGHLLPELKVPSSNIASEQFPRGPLSRGWGLMIQVRYTVWPSSSEQVPGAGAQSRGQVRCILT